MTAPTEAGAIIETPDVQTWLKATAIDIRGDHRRMRRVTYRLLSAYRKRADIGLGGLLCADLVRGLVCATRSPLGHRRPATGAQR